MKGLDRIVFFGTPEFAVPSLTSLIDAGLRPRLVVAQPSRPSGRGRKLTAPPVVKVAEQHDIPVSQPRRVRGKDFLETMTSLRPQLAVVVAFGQIFPQRLLDIPEHGCINVHASLLPAYRGAAPIQAALAAGDEVTGVTTMRMDAGMDTGPMLRKRVLEIRETETAEELSPRLAALGGELLLETLTALAEGELEAEPQGEKGVSYAPQIRKEDGLVDWKLTSRQLFNRLRAFTPWPGLTARFRGDRVKILWAEPLEDSGLAASAVEGAAPGESLGLVGEALALRCGEGTILGVSRLQRAGRKPLTARDFVNGERLASGERFE